MRFGRRAAVAGALALSLLVGACGSSDDSATNEEVNSNTTLTLYNAQHEDLMQALVDGFTKETGIKVEMRNGEDFELANQIIQEGDASPADVFLTENSPAMVLVAGSDRFSTLNQDTVDQLEPQYVPADKEWTGFAARSTVLAYNKTQLPQAEVPVSIMDLADPKWQGKIGFAPAGADFQAIVSAVVALKGEAAAAEWLKGLKANGKTYRGNGAVMRAVNAGEIQAGVIYHYYWYKDRAESGENSANTELHYFGNQDPGAFLSLSGAGVVKSSKHQEQAQQFVKYVTSKSGQQALANSTALEYAIADGVANNEALKPLSELDPPTVEPSNLNGPRVTELMQQAGLL